jgi:hypothetical protein
LILGQNSPIQGRIGFKAAVWSFLAHSLQSNGAAVDYFHYFV